MNLHDHESDAAAGAPFVKRRNPPEPGSIPDVLGMFVAEVRFYREIAPVVGVRVPECHDARSDEHGTRLVLEDLSDWAPGADPVTVARTLSWLHGTWQGEAATRWPWLRPVGTGAELVGELYDRVWPSLEERPDLDAVVREVGRRLVGRVPAAEQAVAGAGPLTLVHGDVAMGNLRTSPDGVVAWCDWEDVSAVPGVVDLAWFLVTSVSPSNWDEVIAAYGPAPGLAQVFPAIAGQGLLSLGDTPVGSQSARDWCQRLAAAHRRMS